MVHNWHTTPEENYLFSTLQSLQVLIPSTFQSGQKPAKAVPRAIAAMRNETIFRPVPICTKMPAMRSTMPTMIRITLSNLPTFFSTAYLLFWIVPEKMNAQHSYRQFIKSTENCN